MDEDCAAVRVQLDSQPEVIDKLQRRRMQLEIELRAITKETSQATADTASYKEGLEKRAADVKAEMEKVDSELRPLQLWHESEQKRLTRMQEARRNVEETRRSIQELERRYSLDRVAELKYETLPQLERELQQLTDESQTQVGGGTASDCFFSVLGGAKGVSRHSVIIFYLYSAFGSVKRGYFILDCCGLL